MNITLKPSLESYEVHKLCQNKEQFMDYEGLNHASLWWWLYKVNISRSWKNKLNSGYKFFDYSSKATGLFWVNHWLNN